ncbi:H-NS histone family protein [Variovorax sp.]|uniref:H-NS histone family protein n=2 Tax=Variovorax sp. TaxID=1871043 RepID=UPI0025EC0DF9|nr:H-NS histone family protein [Variovorax sp.]
MHDRFLFLLKNPITMKNERLKALAEETQKLKERLAQIADEEVQERQKDLLRVVDAFKAALTEHGLRLEEAMALLQSSSSRRGSGKRQPNNAVQKAPPVVYKNPEGSKTWGGIGRKPKWVSEAEKRGLTLEELKAKS